MPSFLGRNGVARMLASPLSPETHIVRGAGKSGGSPNAPAFVERFRKLEHQLTFVCWRQCSITSFLKFCHFSVFMLKDETEINDKVKVWKKIFSHKNMFSREEYAEPL